MIHHGDCLTVMQAMEPDSVDAVVTDPPYGLEFMGKQWDSFKDSGTSALLHSPKDEGRIFTNESGHMWDNTKALPRFPKAGREYQAWCTEWAREAFRVAKPGAYLLAFGGTRTVHRLASAIEDAGWEIRDELIWVYASGFPKSLDVSKALDRAAGAEREVTGSREVWGLGATRFADKDTPVDGDTAIPITAPATDLAKQWEGWGTALKPAHEPIVMARKPLVGSVAANVTRYGTGALNIGATRIPSNGEEWEGRELPNAEDGVTWGGALNQSTSPSHPQGRWPSNLLLSDPELFDVANPGVVGSGAAASVGGQSRAAGVFAHDPHPNQSGYGFGERDVFGYGDSGGYSRFFKIPTHSAQCMGCGHETPAGVDVHPECYDELVEYWRRVEEQTPADYPKAFIVPKADRADREPVLRGQLPKTELQTMGDGANGHDPERPIQRENAHPTVKPTDLMRHLVRLVTPPGGTVLDCFLGSGSTAIACEMEGFAWIGIEKEAEYVAIAEARLNGTQRGLGLDVPAPTTRRGGKPTGEETGKPRTEYGFKPETGWFGLDAGDPPTEDDAA